MRRHLLLLGSCILLSACQAKTLPVQNIQPKDTITSVSKADIHQTSDTFSYTALFPPQIVSDPSLAPLQKILEGVAEQERVSALSSDEPKRGIESLSVAFRLVSKTIRMVSVETYIDTKIGDDETFHLRDFVYDRRQIRMDSFTEMFASKWPNAEAALTNYIAQDIVRQKKSRVKEPELEDAVSTELKGIPLWVLLPGTANRVASGIRFDLLQNNPASPFIGIVQVKVPTSVFWDFLTDDWKQRFEK